jgi:hypothetical protein
MMRCHIPVGELRQLQAADAARAADASQDSSRTAD